MMMMMLIMMTMIMMMIKPKPKPKPKVKPKPTHVCAEDILIFDFMDIFLKKFTIFTYDALWGCRVRVLSTSCILTDCQHFFLIYFSDLCLLIIFFWSMLIFFATHFLWLRFQLLFLSFFSELFFWALFLICFSTLILQTDCQHVFLDLYFLIFFKINKDQKTIIRKKRLEKIDHKINVDTPSVRKDLKKRSAQKIRKNLQKELTEKNVEIAVIWKELKRRSRKIRKN